MTQVLVPVLPQIMWVPYSLKDRAMAFRFSINAAKVTKV